MSKKWKHVATGGLYDIMGVGVWGGGVNDAGKDLDKVTVYRNTEESPFTVVPDAYTVLNVRSADAATLQTSKELPNGAEIVVYKTAGPGEVAVFARSKDEFYDGRFVEVEVDDSGEEVRADVVNASQTVQSGTVISGPSYTGDATHEGS